MLNKLQNEWRSPVIFILLGLIMICLFLSRALLSVSMILLIVFTFFHRDVKGQCKIFFSSPLLWGMSLLFVLPLLSGWWSEDQEKWLDILRIKLPLLVLPLAFAAPFTLSQKQWHRLAYLFIILVTGGTAWCMFHYTADMAAINESYLRARSIRTPLGNDHIRFSWMISIAVLLACRLGWQKRKISGPASYVFFFTALWLIIFLHILAARTGLFSFYLLLVFTACHIAFQKFKIRYSIALILLAVALPLTANFTLPTFHNRVRYFLYEFEYLKKTNYLPGANDASRMLSLKAGWSLLGQYPVTGTGFGDIENKTRQWYKANYPAMLEPDKLYPSSEWLIYGAGSGWPGVLLFTIILLIPFWTSVKNKWLWWMLNCTAAGSFIFDIGLEVQYGVFLYSFITLWWWKWLKDEKV